MKILSILISKLKLTCLPITGVSVIDIYCYSRCSLFVDYTDSQFNIRASSPGF